MLFKKSLFTLLLMTSVSYASSQSQERLVPERPLAEAFQYYSNNFCQIINDNFQIDGSSGEQARNTGTGFIFDADEGIIITNHHVYSGAIIGQPKVVMSDGKAYRGPDVELLYSNPTGMAYDFAILRIRGFKHTSANKLIFEPNPANVKLQTEVGIIGCNEGVQRSLVTGYIADKYEVSGKGEFGFKYLTVPAYTLSAMITGGSSGSPVFDSEKRIIGINHAGTEQHSFVVPIAFVLEAIEKIQRGIPKTIFSTGLTLAAESVDELEQYFRFKDQRLIDKISETEDYRLRMLTVQAIHPLVEQAKQFHVGDIIKAINGEVIGPDYLKLHKLVNEAGMQDAAVTVTIDRFGNELEFQLKPTPYSFERIKGTLIEDGWFLAADSNIRSLYGIPEDTPVTYLNGHETSALMIVSSVAGTQVKTFNQFIFEVNKLLKSEEYSFAIGLSKTASDPGSVMAALDLSTLEGMELFVRQFDQKTNKFVNISYDKYLSGPLKARTSKSKRSFRGKPRVPTSLVKSKVSRSKETTSSCSDD